MKSLSLLPKRAFGTILLLLLSITVWTGCNQDIVVSTESELEEPDPRVNEIRDMMSHLDTAPDSAVLLIGEFSSATIEAAQQKWVMKDGTPYYLVTDYSEVQALLDREMKPGVKGAFSPAGIQRAECTIRADTPKNIWYSGAWTRFGFCVLDLFDDKCDGKIKGRKERRDGVEYYVVTCDSDEDN